MVACIFTYLFRYLFTFSQMPLFGCWEWTHQWYHKVKIYPKNAQSHLTWPFFIIVILGLLKSYVTSKRYTENIISTQNWVGKIDDSVWMCRILWIFLKDNIHWNFVLKWSKDNVITTLFYTSTSYNNLTRVHSTNLTWLM